MSTGYDHIDMNACNARTSQFAMSLVWGKYCRRAYIALILAMSRKYILLSRDEESRLQLSGLRGFDLKENP